MSSISFQDRPFSDRVLIALHPVFTRLARHVPRAFGPPKEDPPHPSAMLVEHNWLWRLIFPRFFRKITVDETAFSELKAAARGSTLVYVAKSIGQLEYHYFNHLFLERGLPLAQYTNALTLRRWMRWGAFWRSISAEEEEIGRLGQPGDPLEDGEIPRMVAQGSSALIVIPPSGLSDEEIFLTGPVRALTSVIEAQRESERPVSVVPLDFLWSRRPESSAPSVVDILFGEKERPGAVRKIVLFWRNYKKRAQAVIGKPIDLASFLESNSGEGDAALALRLRETLTEALNARRRTITGPPLKPKGWFVQEVTGDEGLDERICRIAAERVKPADDLRLLAARYAKEIIADIDYTYIELLDRILTPAFARLYESVHVDADGLRRVKELCAAGPVVFVPNHKSHMDYLVISHILYHNGMTVPHIAAGMNLEFWPLGAIFRRCGAYFIRRAFRGNPIYTAVLETYLKVLIKEGHCQEFFIEGGRSRTGKLLRPKKGMLAMLHRAAKEARVKGLSFIPVAITYDRVIEQKSYAKELEGEAKEGESAGRLLGLTKYLRRQGHRYGSIYVRFGEPIPPADDVEDAAAIDDVAQRICHEINRRLVVTPAAVAAAALLAPARRGVPIEEVKRNWDVVLSYIKAKGPDISQRFEAAPECVMGDATSLLAQAKLIARHADAVEPFFSIDEGRRVPLAFYKNGAVHFLATIGVTSRLLLKREARDGASMDDIVRDFESCRRLLAHEFRFATCGSVREHVDAAMGFLADQGALVRIDGSAVRVQGERAWMCELFAQQIQPFVETLAIAFRHASERMKGGEDERSLVSAMMQTGQDLYLLGKIRYREAITKAGFENAIRALVSYDILHQSEPTASVRHRKIYAPADSPDAIPILKAELEKLL